MFAISQELIISWELVMDHLHWNKWITRSSPSTWDRMNFQNFSSFITHIFLYFFYIVIYLFYNHFYIVLL